MPTDPPSASSQNPDGGANAQAQREEEQKREALRRMLIEGEESGIAGPLDIEKIKRQAHEEAGLTPS